VGIVDAGALAAVEGLSMKYSAMTDSKTPNRIGRISNFFMNKLSKRKGSTVGALG
jgi:hypothetical protein